MFQTISNLFGHQDAENQSNSSPKLEARTLRPSPLEERRVSSRSVSSAESQRPMGAGLLAKPVSDKCDNDDDSESTTVPAGRARFVRQDSADGDTNWRQGSRSSFTRQTSMRIPTQEASRRSFQRGNSGHQLDRSKSSGRDLDRTKSTGSILGAAPPSILGCGDEVSRRSILGCGEEASKSLERAKEESKPAGLLGDAPPSHQQSFKRLESTGSILGASPPPHSTLGRSVSMSGSILGDNAAATPTMRDGEARPKQPLLRFRRTDTPLPKENASVPHMRKHGTFVRPPMPNRSSTRGILDNVDNPPHSVYTSISENEPYSAQQDGIMGAPPGLLESVRPGFTMPPGLSAPPGLERQVSEDPPRTISLSRLLSRQKSGTNAGANAPGMAAGPDGSNGFRLRRTNSNFSAILESNESSAILSSA